jgi:hypothetical protein
VSFVVSFFPIYACCGAAVAEANESGDWNAQVTALFYSEILAVVGFFVFAFSPGVIAFGWPWIRYLWH